MSEAFVIGSGFGGLALAIRLQSAGIQTTLFESRERPGGRAYVYEDQGFTFDAGPTVITAPQELADLFALSGRDIADYIELKPLSPFYRLLWEDGYRFDYGNAPENLVEDQIQAKNPRDVQGYRKFLRYSEKLLEKGYVELGAVPFLRFTDMLRAAPKLALLRSYRSVYSMVARFVRDEHLRQAFSFHTLLIGGHPHRSSSIYALVHALEMRWGVFFPTGGTGALVRALVKLFTDIGGKLRLEEPVREILTWGDEVRGLRLTGGELAACKFVASNADIVHTYDRLLDSSPQGQAMASKLRKRRYSPSLFVIYFGVKKKYPDIAHHSILFGNRYRRLLDEIYDGPSLPEDFSLYLHAPSVTDPSLAPPDCSCFYVLSPVPHLGKADIDWEREGPAYRDRILKHLDEKWLPGLLDNLVVTRTFTPLDFRDELGAHLGSAFSLEPVLTQSAYFRGHNRDPNLRGLYLVGAGVHPGAGIPGVIASAKATAGLMLKDLAASS